MLFRRMFVLSATAVAVSASTASAQLLDLGPGSFTPLAPVITFSEVSLGTVNPTYSFLGVPGLGNVTVSFAGSFVGQTVTAGFPRTITGTPSGTLTLSSEITRTVSDGAPGATCPCLSGDPTFNGPISVLFSTPVAAVGLKGGYFDAIGGTTIQAFDATGTVLGAITNSATGFEFYGLATMSGLNTISGISFYITGSEPAGFQIDNLTFGAAGHVIPTVPEPMTMVLLGTGLAGVGLARRRRRATGHDNA